MTLKKFGAMFAMFVLLPGYALAAGGSRGGAPSGMGSGPSAEFARTPEEIAESRYNRGLKKRDKAWKYEAKAAEADSEKKRSKLEAKAQKQFKKSITDFRRAIDKNPILYQAHSSLGYALRRTGQYEAALQAYDEALRLQPAYAEAVEYRAEAYLGLDRLDEVKAAYVQLFGLERARADELMQAFVQQRERKPDGLAPEALAEFATWVRERREIAQQTARLSETDLGRW